MINVIRNMRLLNLGMIALTMFFVRYFIIYPVYNDVSVTMATGFWDFILLVFCTLLIAGAAYIINDFFDILTDKNNRKAKKYPDGFLEGYGVKLTYFIMNIAALGISFYLAYSINFLKLSLIIACIIVLLWLYSSRYQKIPLAGNFVIAFLLAFVVLFVWLFEFFSLRDEPILFANMVNSFSLINMFVWSYAAFAFWASFLREMIKDIEDAEGDSVAAYSTFPLRFGFLISKRTALLLSIVLALALLWAAYHLFVINLLPLAIFVIIVLFPMSVLIVIRIIQSREAKDFHTIGNLLKIFIFSGILSMQLFYLSF